MSGISAASPPQPSKERAAFVCASLHPVPNLPPPLTVSPTQCAIQPSPPPPLHRISRASRLAAVLGALAAVDAALASLLAHEAAAQHGETAGEAAAVLLLLRRRALLLVHGLLVLHLLGRRALLVALLGVAGGRQSHIKMRGEEGRLITLGAGRTTAAGTAAAGCCSSLGQTLWKCCCEFFMFRGCCVLGFKTEACENA